MPDSLDDKLRSASEFPRTLEGLEPETVDRYYQEMRGYVISSNRSRGQLKSYNKKNRDRIADLTASHQRLQAAINELEKVKKLELQKQAVIIDALKGEVTEMGGYLEDLSTVFNDISHFADPNTNIGSPDFMSRVMRFLRAVANIVNWWQRQDTSDQPPTNVLPASPQPEFDGGRREEPRMHTSPDAVNRAVYDDVG